jgi:hypothetical protein
VNHRHESLPEYLASDRHPRGPPFGYCHQRAILRSFRFILPIFNTISGTDSSSIIRYSKRTHFPPTSPTTLKSSSELLDLDDLLSLTTTGNRNGCELRWGGAHALNQQRPRTTNSVPARNQRQPTTHFTNMCDCKQPTNTQPPRIDGR